jgi:hypothetical protein
MSHSESGEPYTNEYEWSEEPQVDEQGPEVKRFVIAIDFGTTYSGKSRAGLNVLHSADIYQVLLMQPHGEMTARMRILKSSWNGVKDWTIKTRSHP